MSSLSVGGKKRHGLWLATLLLHAGLAGAGHVHAHDDHDTAPFEHAQNCAIVHMLDGDGWADLPSVAGLVFAPTDVGADMSFRDVFRGVVRRHSPIRAPPAV